MPVLNFLLAAALLAIAAVQLNDPDPLYWIAVYTGGAAVAVFQALGCGSRFWTGVVIGAVLAGMVISLPGTFGYLASGDYASIFGDMRPGNFVEPAREFFGLLLLLVLLCIYVRRQ